MNFILCDYVAETLPQQLAGFIHQDLDYNKQKEIGPRFESKFL